MTIHPKLATYLLNDEQRAIISHKQGPLLVIAGPGSGKTRSLTLLAMNLLLCGNAQPSELVLCTYTEKAAYEMQDRITHIAKDVEYEGDLSQLRIGTIHSICNQFITEYLHYTPLGNNYETLDQFPQQLLIFEHFDEICAYNKQVITCFLERWETRWQTAKKLQSFFDKIAEELIFDNMKASFSQKRPTLSNASDTFLYYLAHAYKNYHNLLVHKNCLDFAHLQKHMYDLLQKPTLLHKITKSIRYVLVDEYQDTNYIQEQILTLLTSAMTPRNLCVVGDEDQALYRFRGATVRNILEFSTKFPECRQIYLTTNYRSHPGIIDTYNRWMTTIDWSNPDPKGNTFRTLKTTYPAPGKHYTHRHAVLSIVDTDAYNEAEQFAEIVFTLKKQGNITDYNQVALLLPSVRPDKSGTYITALKKRGIKSFCPRARTYFDQQEVRLLIGCFTRILNYQEYEQDAHGKGSLYVEQGKLSIYIGECQQLLMQECASYPMLENEFYTIQDEIFFSNKEQQLMDFFYRLVFCKPLMTFLEREEPMHNLVLFSQLLHTFQKYYHHSTINQQTLRQVETDFFHTFLCLLHEEGLNQYENPQMPFPSDHVQIMTIHQAKGLEFPVIAVGRMDKPSSGSKNSDKDLQRFYHQDHFEPTQRIPAFDLRRHYYVAFSRAQSLLILTAKKQPHPHVASLWQGLPTWSVVREGLRRVTLYDKTHKYESPKPRYSFTNHIQMYTTCPRKFQFFREYNFLPAHSVEAFAGLLVHQTLERLHRFVLDDKLDELSDKKIQQSFERVFTFLSLTHMIPLDKEQKEEALHQVLNYVHLNQQELQSIKDAEMGIQVEKDSYVLTGKIDLVMQTTDGLEILDFKTRTRLESGSERLAFYKQQLYLYAYALARRTGQLPKRLLLYWTAEECKQDAMMEIPFTASHIKQASQHFDDVVTKIQQHQFAIAEPPEPEICQRCDIRHYCIKQGIFR